MIRSKPTFEGSPAAAAFIERVQAFVRNELDPLAAAHGIDHGHGGDKALLQRVWKLSHERGFYGMTLPEDMGGAGFGTLDHALIKEAIYASGTVFAPHVLGELSGPPRLGALIKAATPEQMQRLIAPVARGDQAICFAITEPGAGSDAASLQTRADAVSDSGGDGYLLNGVKRFISGSPFCDMAVIIAATDPDQRETTAFFVERDRPGFRIEAGYKTMAGQSH
ncbi:MAG TPA: acyl-CoA dehydrogenase family protein, partial [Rubrivivax sp.]|nr:acyl-CoA dehydrogenase family protein [Rubrivivax sp.]